MLPGFRFLFAAIVLSMSILVFGLGAAALLRAAHEEFASTPTWRAAPETVFAQPAETTRPVLALLRVDAPVVAKAANSAPADATPAGITAAPEPERIAALKPQDSLPPEAAKPETPIAESRVIEGPVQNETASAPADAPAAAAETKVTETRIATSEGAALPADQAAVPQAATPVASEPPGTPEANFAATRIATLGGPPVTIETPQPVKVETAKPASNVIEKRRQAKHAARRHRLAARARLAIQEPPQPANPFGQPAPTIVRRR